MTYVKLVNGIRVKMSPQEIAERHAEEVAWTSTKAEREKQNNLSALDAQMPRYVEDIIDAMDSGMKARLAQETLARYLEKKTLRQANMAT